MRAGQRTPAADTFRAHRDKPHPQAHDGEPRPGSFRSPPRTSTNPDSENKQPPTPRPWKTPKRAAPHHTVARRCTDRACQVRRSRLGHLRTRVPEIHPRGKPHVTQGVAVIKRAGPRALWLRRRRRGFRGKELKGRVPRRDSRRRLMRLTHDDKERNQTKPQHASFAAATGNQRKTVFRPLGGNKTFRS